MGSIWYITLKSFSWANENWLSDQVLRVCCCWNFTIMHLFYLFLPYIIFDFFFLLKASLWIFLDMNNVTRVSVILNTTDLLTILSVWRLIVPLTKHMKLYINYLRATYIFLSFLQYSYYCSVFYFLYFAFLNLMFS